MGLAQRRIVSEFQSTAFNKWKEKFNKAIGFNVSMEVKWDTMQSEDYQDRDDYFKWYEAVYFTPLMKVFEDICGDAMGKKAVKEGLKKIIIDGSDGSAASHSSFEDGVFTLLHRFNTNVDDGNDRVKTWKKMIESKI